MVDDATSKGVTDGTAQTGAMPSNLVDGVRDTPVEQREQVMGFVDDREVFTVAVDTGEDPTMHYETFEDANLSEFFGRPVKIYSSTWDVGTDIDFQINPWQLYFAVNSVAKKLDNFHMMRCNLHIKIQMNGSPFHYSRLLFYYQPLPEWNVDHDPMDASYSRAMSIMKASMLPSAFVSPTEQVPLEMTLPFIKPTNYIRTADMITPSGGNDKSAFLGRLGWISTTPLEAVSATATSTIPFVIFAWATDVELVIPTNTNVSAGKREKKKKSVSRPRNNKERFQKVYGTAKDKAKNKLKALSQQEIPPDEEKDGIVSSVSSVVANVAGKLSDVPFIGDYAGMVKGAANGVTSLARFFGLARPPILTDPSYVKRAPFASVAHTIGNETVEKLTFDPKQALTIDPAATGLGPQDEMSFGMMATKDCLFDTVIWPTTAAEDDELFWGLVSPTYNRSVTRTGDKVFLQTPLAHASYPFKYWSGSLIYRFQFVCSKYHKGRIRLTYEPHGAAYSADNYNTTYSEIIDLSETTDVKFVVPWAQTLSYKLVNPNIVNEFFIPPGGILAYNEALYNGVIYLTVLNPLASPDALKDITINCFISAGEDFELSVPRTNAVSKLAVEDYVAASQPSQVEPSLSVEAAEKMTNLFGEPLDKDEVCAKQSVFFGEAISSFRPLVKRYEYVNRRFTDNETLADGEYAVFKIWQMNVPHAYGFCPSGGAGVGYAGYTTSNSGTNFNSGNTSLINYLATAYLGYKGEFRYKGVPSIGAEIPNTAYSASRDIDYAVNDTVPTYFSAVGNTKLDSTQLTDFNMNLISTDSVWSGASIQPVNNGQPGFEIGLPYYNQYRFSSCGKNAFGVRYQGNLDSASNEMFVVESISSVMNSTSSPEVRMDLALFQAVGEDFTFNMYLGPSKLVQYTGGVTPPL